LLDEKVVPLFNAPMKTRSEVLAWVCDQFHYHGTAAEIGVKYGEFSNEILKTWRSNLLMVDAWRHFPSGYDDIANVPDWQHLQYMEMALKNTLWAQDRAIVMRALSDKASHSIQEKSLDWVYIDAAHDYENVMKDLTNWWFNVKDDGIIWGDDYLEGRHFNSQFGVKSALDDFLQTHKVKKFWHNEGTSEGIPQWVIVK